jgi:hypothetical protein
MEHIRSYEMKRYLYTIASVVMGVAILAPLSASAVPLSGAGTTDFPITGTTAANRPELGGVVLEDKITEFTISGAGETLTGTIQNRVVRSELDGTLDFYWRIVPTSGNGDLLAFRVSGFEGFTLDADWRIDGLGDVAPDTARYFGDGSGDVNFLFSNNEVGFNQAGSYEESMFFFLDTDATSYSESGRFDLLCAEHDCMSITYSTFAPTAVPIPAALWLFGSGIVGLMGFSRRRQA